MQECHISLDAKKSSVEPLPFLAIADQFIKMKTPISTSEDSKPFCSTTIFEP